MKYLPLVLLFFACMARAQDYTYLPDERDTTYSYDDAAKDSMSVDHKDSGSLSRADAGAQAQVPAVGDEGIRCTVHACYQDSCDVCRWEYEQRGKRELPSFILKGVARITYIDPDFVIWLRRFAAGTRDYRIVTQHDAHLGAVED